MDNNFNNDDDKTVLIQPDQFGNPTVQPQSQPVQPQFNQAPQGQPMQPEFGQGMQGQPVQPQFGQGMQSQPMQPQFNQAPQGQPMQPQFGQGMQGMPAQPQFGQGMQGMPTQPQFGQAPQMSLNNGGNNNPPKKGKGGMIAIISVCAVAVIALIVGLVLILGGNDKKDKKTTEATTEATTEKTTEATTEETTEATTEETTEATTEATTEETTEATTEAPAAAGDGSTLVDVSSMGFSTNDWKSLEFAIDGTVYTWPVSYAQIKEAGYAVDSSIESEVLEANYYSFSEWAYNSDDKSAFMVQFKNFTDTDKTVAECDVLGLIFYLDDYEKGDYSSVTLCNGITVGTTYEDVIAIMGEPTDEYVSDDSEFGYRTATYEVNDDIYASCVEFTFMDGVVDDLEIQNYD